MQVQCLRGDGVQTLVQIAVGGGDADPGVADSAAAGGGVSQPGQQQEDLCVHRAGPLGRPSSRPALGQVVLGGEFPRAGPDEGPVTRARPPRPRRGRCPTGLGTHCSEE